MNRQSNFAPSMLALVVSCFIASVARGQDSPFENRLVDSTVATPSTAISADIDNDGDNDIVEVASGGDTLLWWENNGGNADLWVAHGIDFTFDGAADVIAADIDGDGDQDLVGAATFGDEVAWWENLDGVGGVWAPRDSLTTTFDGASTVFVADIDGDTHLDIVAAAFFGGLITWWSNDLGDGTMWTEHPVSVAADGVGEIEAADIDGDDDLDLATSSLTTHDITWWENLNGDGTGWQEHVVDGAFLGAADVTLADVDGDDDIDLLGVAATDDDVTWWENTMGDGTVWVEHTIFAILPNPRAVIAVDLDLDTDLDIVAVSQDLGQTLWWENVGGGGFVRDIVDLDLPNIATITAGDLNGDGTQDLIGTSFVGGRVEAWINHFSPAIVREKHVIADPVPDAFTLAPADVDGDGWMDLVGVAAEVQQISWWRNEDGTGPTMTPHAIGGDFGGMRRIAIADLDGDDDPDVLVSVEEEGDLIWHENLAADGLSWTPHTVDASFPDPRQLLSADLDNDTMPDVVAVSEGSGIAWWRNVNGDGLTWTKTTIDATFAGSINLDVADMDGDTDLDVVATSRTLHEANWWENVNGDGSVWTKRLVSTGLPGARPVVAHDLDGDTDTDLVIGAFGGLDLFWFENLDGVGQSWGSHDINLDFDAFSLHIVDLDQDGAPDIVGAGRNQNLLSWWRNGNGDGSVFARHDIDRASVGANSVSSADMNGDGTLDVVAAAFSDEQFSWYAHRVLVDVGLPCPEDANDDGVVGVLNFLGVLINWGPCGGGACAAFDSNDDGLVGIIDFLAVLAHWGACP